MNKQLFMWGLAIATSILLIGWIVVRLSLTQPSFETRGPSAVNNAPVQEPPVVATLPRVEHQAMPSLPALTAPPTVAPTQSAQAQAKIAALTNIQQRLFSATTGGKTLDPKELDKVLVDLTKAQGSDVVGGVNISALRETLSSAAKLQILAKQMEQEAKQAQPDSEKIQALMAQIQAAQAGLKLPVIQAPAEIPSK